MRLKTFALLSAVPLARAALIRATRAVFDRNVRALSAGDHRPLLSAYAQDAQIVFPGDHTWAGTFYGRTEIERFFMRFVRAGLAGEIEDILIQGPPWNTRIAAQFNDRALADDGTVVYENRAVVWVRARWGRIVAEEVYEDCQRVADFDAWLTTHRPAAMPSTEQL